MEFLPKTFQKLIDEFRALPGVGPKSAQRLAFHCLKQSPGRLQVWASILNDLHEKTQSCQRCFTLSEHELCSICESPLRSKKTICVVENTMDLMAIEKTGEYKALYHVLQGKLSPLDGVGPQDIRIQELWARVQDSENEVEELILALNPDMEGDSTCLYIEKLFQSKPEIKLTRLARGLPSGAHLEYMDDHTLIRALEGRL